MANFQALNLNQRLMDQMGIYFHDSGSTRSFSKCRKSAVAYIILFNLLIGAIISPMNIYDANEFSEKSFAFGMFVAMCQGFGVSLSMRLKTKNVTDLHHNLQSIVNKGSLGLFFIILTSFG